MKKNKIFAILIIFISFFTSIAFASYINNTNNAPSNNTNEVLKVDGSGSTTLVFEKIGVWEGEKPSSSNIISKMNVGSYAGNVTGKKGFFSDKLVINGATTFLQSDLITQVKNSTGNFFDQYSNTATYEYPEGSNNKYNSKPLQAIISGRMLGAISITNDADIGTNNNSNPNRFSLDFQATSNTNGFNPTTNIGLGNSCDLYPSDIGTIKDGTSGGCPAGSFISYYKPPVFSGTLSSSNNNNSKKVITCTEFNPSVNPTNVGHCSTSSTWTDLTNIAKEQDGSLCRFTAGNGTSNSFTGFENSAKFNGKNIKIKWYNGGFYDYTLDNKTYFTYGCGSGIWSVVVTDDYGQYAEASM